MPGWRSGQSHPACGGTLAMKYFVYILQSGKDGSYYVGVTSSLNERLRKHNCNHRGYTAKKKPYKVLYSEEHSVKSIALKREKQIKSYKGGRAFKELICRVGGVVNRT